MKITWQSPAESKHHGSICTNVEVRKHTSITAPTIQYNLEQFAWKVIRGKFAYIGHFSLLRNRAKWQEVIVFEFKLPEIVILLIFNGGEDIEGSKV